MGTLRRTGGTLRRIDTGETFQAETPDVRWRAAEARQKAARMEKQARTLEAEYRAQMELRSAREKQARQLEAVYRAQTDRRPALERLGQVLDTVYQANLGTTPAVTPPGRTQGSGSMMVQKVQPSGKAARWAEGMKELEVLPKGYYAPGGMAETSLERGKKIASSTVKSMGGQFTGAGATVMDALNRAGEWTSDTIVDPIKDHMAQTALERERNDLARALERGDKERERMARLRIEETERSMQKRREEAGKGFEAADRDIGKIYDAAYRLSNGAAEDAAAAKEGLNGLEGLMVDAIIAGGQMAGDMGAAALTGGSAMPFMVARAFGGASLESKADGATPKQQLAYATGSGVLSAVTEKLANVAAPFKKAFGSGVLDNAISKAVEKLGGSVAGKLALAALSEGGEELVEAVFQPVLQRLTYDPGARFDLEGALHDAAVGAILGAVGGGAEVLGTRRTGTAAWGTDVARPSQSSTGIAAGRAPDRAGRAFVGNDAARPRDAARPGAGTETAKDLAGRIIPRRTGLADGTGIPRTPVVQRAAGETLRGGKTAGRTLRPGYAEPGTGTSRVTVPAGGPNAAAWAYLRYKYDIVLEMRRRQAELEQYETELDWAMDLEEQASAERKILEAREDLFQCDRELKTPGMMPLQRLREDLARYQEELEWAIDPWERSFWEEKLAKTQEDLAWYGWDLEPLEIQRQRDGDNDEEEGGQEVEASTDTDEKDPLSTGLEHDTIGAKKEGGGYGQGARPESARRFLERSIQAFHRVRESGDVIFGFRRPLQSGVSRSARAFQRELTALGVPCELVDGEVEWNLDGMTKTRQFPEAATYPGKIVFINGVTTVSPKDGAGHEAYHFWKHSKARRVYTDIILDNLQYSSEAFLDYYDRITQAYFGEDIDIFDWRQFDKLMEELGAYISGHIYEGRNDAQLRGMFRDYDAVKEAWQAFIKEVTKEGR